jgi:predicted DNA binding CopG/RHH family protein
MNEYIDIEEKEIIESLYEKDWEPNPDANINRIYEEFARKNLEFNQKIEINLPERDFHKIKVKAIQEGTTSDVIISLLIHNYNEGKIVLNI